MAAMNSLLLLLTTLSPLEPPYSTNSFETTQYPWQINKDLEQRQCPSNEVYNDCGTACPRTCSNWQEDSPCTSKCVRGCFCEEGMVRGDDGTCIWPSECPHSLKRSEEESSDLERTEEQSSYLERKCPKHEQYLRCGTACERNCSNWMEYNRTCTDKCIEGCFCKGARIRGVDGKCIWPSQCPVTESSSICSIEVVGNGSVLCQRWGNEAECNITCDGRWFGTFACRSGEWDDVLPYCVQEIGVQNVLERRRCPMHEHYVKCGTSCPKNCSNWRDNNRTCIDVCIEGCFCKGARVRGPDGNCIWIDQCPDLKNEMEILSENRKCPEHEEYLSCGTACPRNCLNWKEENPPCTHNCVEGCFCKGARIRGPDGKCIWPDQCPESRSISIAKETCSLEIIGKGSVWCASRGHETKCSIMCDKQRYRPFSCKSGEWSGMLPYCVRAKDSTAKDTCSLEIIGKGSFWCHSFGKETKCNIICDRQPYITISCKFGEWSGMLPYCAREKEETVRPQQMECKWGEIFRSCKNLCPATCEDHHPREPCVHHCIPGCDCMLGLVRNSEEKCVVPDQCHAKSVNVFPIPTLCKSKELFKLCRNICPTTCENKGPREPCVFPCLPGCDCASDFVRTDEGECIRPDLCSNETTNALPISSVCGENAEFKTCKNLCPPTCANRGPHKECKMVCLPGCQCLPGYVLSPKNECIKPDQCLDTKLSIPVQCKDNKVFSMCANPCPSTCENYKAIFRPCMEACKADCECIYGSVLGPDGTCIAPEQCPSA